ncbi:SAM-dependent methyltransferase [Nocardia altamirensis]|uniref:SAM-dependent methyltransferase n=1 Tax=Nocardia altamirensis TaxID=472158 RepID=UPI0008404139|nr:SAM-dependent methyltransferase [Nocardia altamirensis]
MSEVRRVPKGVDTTKPNAARVYNFMLGGKDNYEIDQMFAAKVLEVAPDTKTQAWFSRRFLIKATTIAAENGVRQFIDLGAGIPISPSPHEVAKEHDATARVIFVDYDPVVMVHADVLVSGVEGVTPLLADARRPDELIEILRTQKLIDFDEPVAVLAVGLLHYVMDDEHPADILARFRDAMAPGSYFAFTHASTETAEAFIARAANLANSSSQVRFRTQDDVAALLDGYEIVEPGVVPVQRWIGDDLPDTTLAILGAIGRKP